MTKRLILAALVSLFFGSQAWAECPAAPDVPTIVDGSKASMEELIENSKAVKAFIADADAYLDCEEAKSKEMAETMDKEEMTQRMESLTAITKKRNAIGDEFNAEVAAYKEANPKE